MFQYNLPLTRFGTNVLKCAGVICYILYVLVCASIFQNVLIRDIMFHTNVCWVPILKSMDTLCTHTYTHTHTHTHLHTHIHTHTQAHTHTHIYIYIYIIDMFSTKSRLAIILI